MQVERSRSWVVSQAIDQYLSRAESDRPKGWTEADEEESIRIAGDALAEGAAS